MLRVRTAGHDKVIRTNLKPLFIMSAKSEEPQHYVVSLEKIVAKNVDS